MLWLFAILVTLTFGFNKLIMKYGFKNLNYKRTLSKDMVEIGETFEIITTIENSKPFPVTYLRIKERFPAALTYPGDVNMDKTKDCFEFTTTLFILPYQRVKRIYSVCGRERGCFIFRNADLELGDFIGLNTFSITKDYLQELVILPGALDLDENLVLYGNYYGQISIGLRL
ncbi:hypothetical protein [Schnuerera ultunensis]|uniref:DUF58 domain-containing protein n=1 Tax=[Clostridium] ultunense Esp TaxID=1288971 RepID=A0A1M4PKQ7_9FIRM|nr:hypothetical protein [Schnuerera ultunensis]SHD76059.1 conserved protein of unknown function [[Clostridium] ultunense Esp]